MTKYYYAKTANTEYRILMYSFFVIMLYHVFIFQLDCQSMMTCLSLHLIKNKTLELVYENAPEYTILK